MTRCLRLFNVEEYPMLKDLQDSGSALLDHPLELRLTTVDVPSGLAIKYSRFTKLVIDDLMNKYPSISSRFEEDYHSIKDDIPLDTTAASPQGKKMKQSDGETSSPQKSLKDRHESHMELLDVDDDDDDENKEEKKDDEMGSLENRTKKMQTSIPTTPGSHRISLSLD
ncbi:hypothetical protein Tco_1420927 [Tanacetum coccineum]